MAVRPGRSRWKRSEITYGPAGRVVATTVVLLPVLVGLFNIFFLIAGLLWLFGIVPLALRQIWRPVRDDNVPGELVVSPEQDAAGPGESIHDRVGPSRW